LNFTGKKRAEWVPIGGNSTLEPDLGKLGAQIRNRNAQKVLLAAENRGQDAMGDKGTRIVWWPVNHGIELS
jgi:hypothetical protein